MTNDPSIFSEKPEGDTTPTNPVEPTNAFDQLLSGIQREDGTAKYKDVPTALNALKESQGYISQLRTELDELKAKATEGATMEQVLEALKPQETKPEEVTPTPTGVTLEDVEAYIKKRDQEQSANRNLDVVSNRCKEVFGDDALSKLTAKAQEVGLSLDMVKKLASTSPTAALKLLGIDKNTPTTPSLHTSVNTETLTEQPSTQPSSVMGHIDNKDLLANWTATKEIVNKKYEL